LIEAEVAPKTVVQFKLLPFDRCSDRRA
jgi:hypothetical protein